MKFETAKKIIEGLHHDYDVEEMTDKEVGWALINEIWSKYDIFSRESSVIAEAAARLIRED